MRRLMLAAFSTLVLAGPVLADPPKERKICKAVNNGNPLFPQMKCRTVPIETPQSQVAAAPVAAAPTPVAPAAEPSAMTAANTVAVPK